MFRTKSGCEYRGEYRNGLINGTGIFTREDGSVIHTGHWRDGKPVAVAANSSDNLSPKYSKSVENEGRTLTPGSLKLKTADGRGPAATNWNS